jgi:hypothetical protein
LDAYQTGRHRPIIGATKPLHLDDAIAAVSVQLTLKKFAI